MISLWSFFSEKANWETELPTNWNGGDLCEDVEKWVAIGVDNVVSKRLLVVGEEVDRVHGLRGQPIQEAASGRFKSFFDLNNLQPVILLHQLHGPWPRDLHTFQINIIINSLVFDLCEHVGPGRLPRQDRLRAGLVHSWQGGQGPAANLKNWLRLGLRMVDMYNYVIGLTLSSQVKYQKNLFRNFFVIDIIDIGRGVRSTLHFSPKILRI